MSRILILLAFSSVVLACGPREENLVSSPESAAIKFLSHIDQENYGESWSEASELVRTTTDATQWETHVGNYRRPLGVIDSREVDWVEFHDSLEGMPDGKYALVAFSSLREWELDAAEMVGLTQEADSVWRVIGYQIL